MADIDEELAKNLKAAKKKARNFAMILKGTKLVGLILSKKAIKAGEKTAAKSEFGGNVIVEGVCVGEGADLVFKIQGQEGGEPGVKIAQFKDFVDEHAGLKIKPRFEMVGDLPVVEEKEEEGSEGETDEGGTAPPIPPPPQGKGSEVQQSPPPAPPKQQEKGTEVPPAPAPAPTQQPGDELKSLVAAMNKLSDGIKSAVASHPNQKADLLKHVVAFQGQVKAGDVPAAKASLLAVGSMLKQLSGHAPVPPVAPPPPPETTSQAPPVAPPVAPPPDRAAVDWEREFARLEPRYLEALKTSNSDAASKLRVVFTYATEQAEARAFDKALGALKRLEPLLDAAQQVPSGGASSEIEKGIVEKRKFMLTRLKAIPGEIQPSLNKLKEAIAREVPEENADELAKAIEASLQEFYDQIQGEIDDAINAGNSKVLAGLKKRVLGNALIEHLYTNPLSEGAAFRDSLIDALDEIEQKLAS